VSFLIDTNIISELRKGRRCDAHVAAWFESADDSDLYLSVLVLGEIRKGIELARLRDRTQAETLAAWLRDVTIGFGNRILPIDRDVAEEWGRMNAIRPVPVIDGLLAASAKVHGMILVTRDAEDVAGLGAEVLNPFRASPSR